MKRLLIVGAILMMAGLAFAEEPGSDWTFYGSARLGGAYWNRGHWYRPDTLGNTVEDTFPAKNFMYDMQFNSRFGALIHKDKIGFRFEAGWGYALRDQKIDFNQHATVQRILNVLTLRRLYGEWNINEFFTLLIGQDWNIANFLASNQVFDMEQGLTYCGALYTGRRPQVKFTYKQDRGPFNWNVQLALARADTFLTPTGSEYEEAEEMMPKIESGGLLDFKSKIVDAGFQVIGGVAAFKQINKRTDDTVHNNIAIVNSNCLAFEVHARVWKFKATFDYAQGRNLAVYGVFMGDPEGFRGTADNAIFYPYWGFKDSMAQVALDKSLCFPFIKQGCFVINFKPFTWLAGEWGMGRLSCKLASFDQLEQLKLWPSALKRSAWYLNLQFSLANDHVFIVPEYSYSDLGGGKETDLGKSSGGRWWAVGLKLQIDM